MGANALQATLPDVESMVYTPAGAAPTSTQQADRTQRKISNPACVSWTTQPIAGSCNEGWWL